MLWTYKDMFDSTECGLRAWAQEEDGWLVKSQLLGYKEIAMVQRLGFLICAMNENEKSAH